MRLTGWKKWYHRMIYRAAPERLLFYRNFLWFTGGHAKVRDYFDHAGFSRYFQPSIYFTPESVWDESNPWLAMRAQCLPAWQPEQAGALFLAGLDWQAVPEAMRSAPPVPVINLIQGIRHALPGDARQPFLRYRAVRVCVSQEIADALQGQANGPVFVNPNGLDTRCLPPAPARRTLELLVAGYKEPELARRLQTALAGRVKNLRVLTEILPQAQFHKLLGQAEITVFLPYQAGEGFYLPALEGMAQGTLVICPDCVGNRAFCQPGYNAWRPAYTEAAIIEAVQQALRLPPEARAQLRENARQTVARHSLEQERAGFLAILDNLRHIW